MVKQGKNHMRLFYVDQSIIHIMLQSITFYEYELRMSKTFSVISILLNSLQAILVNLKFTPFLTIKLLDNGSFLII